MCFLINSFCLIKTIGAAFVAKALNVSDKVVTLGIWVSAVTLDFIRWWTTHLWLQVFPLILGHCWVWTLWSYEQNLLQRSPCCHYLLRYIPPLQFDRKDFFFVGKKYKVQHVPAQSSSQVTLRKEMGHACSLCTHYSSYKSCWAVHGSSGVHVKFREAKKIFLLNVLFWTVKCTLCSWDNVYYIYNYFFHMILWFHSIF